MNEHLKSEGLSPTVKTMETALWGNSWFKTAGARQGLQPEGDSGTGHQSILEWRARPESPADLANPFENKAISALHKN
jgi:hypothetical protein